MRNEKADAYSNGKIERCTTSETRKIKIDRRYQAIPSMQDII